MPKILPPPVTQFSDANGHPFAAGTVALYIPGTDTPKDSWTDHEGTALNTNPIVLDAAGRGIILGSGEYRMVLKDALGNLIYDQWTTSLVSDAMQPVVIAATIAEAQALLGIESVGGERDRALAAEAALDAKIEAEKARALAAEALLRTDLDAEIVRAKAREDALEDMINAIPEGMAIRFGSGTTDATGTAHVTFSPAFKPGFPVSLAATGVGPGWLALLTISPPNESGADIYIRSDQAFGPPVVAGFFWIAVGTEPD